MKHLLAAARQCALRIPAEAAVCCAAAFLLTAVSTGGQYAPWALAAVAVAGVGWRGLAATACAGVGALAFLDFQPGLRHAAAAVLIFCANTAFCPSRLYRHPRFRPTAAVCAAAAPPSAATCSACAFSACHRLRFALEPMSPAPD